MQFLAPSCHSILNHPDIMSGSLNQQQNQQTHIMKNRIQSFAKQVVVGTVVYPLLGVGKTMLASGTALSRGGVRCIAAAGSVEAKLDATLAEIRMNKMTRQAINQGMALAAFAGGVGSAEIAARAKAEAKAEKAMTKAAEAEFSACDAVLDCPA